VVIAVGDVQNTSSPEVEMLTFHVTGFAAKTTSGVARLKRKEIKRRANNFESFHA
jgi:hypothetical protein